MVEILSAACLRYLDFIGTLEDRTPARLDLDHISAPVRDPLDRSWRGFNLFLKEDHTVLLAILRGEFTINGLSNKRLRALLPNKSSGQIARILRRLRLHHLIKRVGHTYRYYLTTLGRRLITTCHKLHRWIILPNLQPAAV